MEAQHDRKELLLKFSALMWADRVLRVHQSTFGPANSPPNESASRRRTKPNRRPVADVVQQIAQSFNWTGPIGIGFPAPIKASVAMMAANVSEKWIGVNADDLFTKATGLPCTMINDADAAGLAEMSFGAGRGQQGIVIIITLGTGIGSAVFYRGNLVPNTEFGHIEIKGEDAEAGASDAARQREDLSWKDFAKRLNRYLEVMNKLFWPDLFIIGGGISKQHEKFIPLLNVSGVAFCIAWA